MESDARKLLVRKQEYVCTYMTRTEITLRRLDACISIDIFWWLSMSLQGPAAKKKKKPEGQKPLQVHVDIIHDQ